MDNSVIFTGLPSIAAALDLGPVGLSWVQDAYVLVAASADAADLTGRVDTALTWATGLLVLCLATVLAVIVPEQRRRR